MQHMELQATLQMKMSRGEMYAAFPKLQDLRGHPVYECSCQSLQHLFFRLVRFICALLAGLGLSILKHYGALGK